MKYQLKKIDNLKEVYDYMVKLSFPYRYEVEYSSWEKSYLYDVDGEGRTLFSDLKTIGAYLDSKLIGFIQYGKTAFGFDRNEEISDSVFYAVIRNFYFDEKYPDAGKQLLDFAVKALSDSTDRIYGFFHYFGMSCYARHGKMFEGYKFIHDLFLESGFTVEHENVFYSSKLQKNENQNDMELKWYDKTLGGQQYCDFILGTDIVGGCEIHFLTQKNIAYLRWIYINEELCGKGIGSKCMSVLKNHLYHIGIRRFDTDTAVSNIIAQHYYEKNHFVKEGITRSYYWDIPNKIKQLH